MEFEALSTKWFVFYYLTLGTLGLSAGSYFMLKNKAVSQKLSTALQEEKPPLFLIRILKYFLIFTLPGFIFSFIPFSWIELLFSIWSLLLVYLAGVQLVRWKQTRNVLLENGRTLREIIIYSSAMMLTVALATFLLSYLVINRAQLQ